MSNPEASSQQTNPNQSGRGEHSTLTRRETVIIAIGTTSTLLAVGCGTLFGLNIGRSQPKEFDPSTTGRITATGPDGREGELSACVGNGANVRNAPGIDTDGNPTGIGGIIAELKIPEAEDSLRDGTPVSDLGVGSIACTRTAGVDFVTDPSTGTTWVKLPRDNSSNPAYTDILDKIAKTGDNAWTLEGNVVVVPVSPDYRTATTTGVTVEQR